MRVASALLVSAGCGSGYRRVGGEFLGRLQKWQLCPKPFQGRGLDVILVPIDFLKPGSSVL